MSQPIKWHGGKFYLAPKIIDLMPDHVHYVEPFFGGGAVLFRKPERLVQGHSEVVNDVFGDLMNFWRVLQSPAGFAEFERRVAAVPFSKQEWEEASRSQSTDTIDRAVAFFIRYRQSRQGLGKDFATLSRTRTRRGMNEQAASWWSAVEGLPQAHARLRRVVILSEDAVDVIRREDGPETFFYCDPPYLSQTRSLVTAYACEMSTDDHERLLDRLGHIQGKFLLSGYRNDIYDSAASRFGWHRTDIRIDNKASAAKTKPRVTECLWANYGVSDETI